MHGFSASATSAAANSIVNAGLPVKTYSNRSNCAAGARTALGKPEAKIGVDFVIVDVDGGRFVWTAYPVPAPQPVASPYAQMKAADLRSKPVPAKLAPMTSIESLTQTPAQNLIADLTDQGHAQKLVDGGLELPGFLKREVETPEQVAARRAKFANLLGPDREIKTPKTPIAKVAKASTANKRPDGLRVGSKQAVMLDLAIAGWTTEATICAALDWKACMVTLRRTCEATGYALERRANPAGGKSEYRAVKSAG